VPGERICEARGANTLQGDWLRYGNIWKLWPIWQEARGYDLHSEKDYLTETRVRAPKRTDPRERPDLDRPLPPLVRELETQKDSHAVGRSMGYNPGERPALEVRTARRSADALLADRAVALQVDNRTEKEFLEVRA